MTLKEVLYKRDDALMEILDRMKGKKLYNNLWVQLKFFWQDTKRAVYCATPWKDAQGDDLPEYDREVIAILDYDFGHYKVVYAHRPNPNGWDGTNIDTGKRSILSQKSMTREVGINHTFFIGLTRDYHTKKIKLSKNYDKSSIQQQRTKPCLTKERH